MEQNKENTSSVSRTLKKYFIYYRCRTHYGYRHLCF